MLPPGEIEPIRTGHRADATADWMKGWVGPSAHEPRLNDAQLYSIC